MEKYTFVLKNKNTKKYKAHTYTFLFNRVSRARWKYLVDFIFDMYNLGNWELVSIEKEVR